MDPKMLKLLRAFLGVDDKLLPDSMSTDDFGKFIDDQKGKLIGNPEDIKNLQKLLTKKDVDFRKTKEALEKLKSNEPNKDDKKETEIEKLSKELKNKIDEVDKKISTINQQSELQALKKQYPDIVPELLAGKDEADIKSTVESQRVINKKLYGDSKQFTQPDYSDVKDIDAKIDEVKADKSMSANKQAVEVMKLNRAKENFSPPEPES